MPQPRTFRYNPAASRARYGSRTNLTPAPGADIAKTDSNRRTSRDPVFARTRRANERCRAGVRPRRETARGRRRRGRRPPKAAHGRHVSARSRCRENFLIAEDGSVAGQRIVSGPELLRPGAESAVNNAEYRPMVLNGKPVMMATTIRLVFKIDNSTDPPTLKVREDLSSDGQAVDAATLESDATFAHPFEKQISSADASKTNGVGYNVKPAHLLVQYAPAYPPDAKRLNIEGSVKLHAVIQKDGSTGGVTYISGPYPLAAAAIEAVKLWKYSPMMLLGKPVDVDTTITVIFTLGH